MSRWAWKNLTEGVVQLSLTGAGALEVQSEGPRTVLRDRHGAVCFTVDRWTHEDVEVTPGPAAAADLGPADQELARVFHEWAAGSRCVGGAALLSSLPAGDYLLVRSSWLPTPAGLVPLGDGWVERGVDHELLTDDEETHAVIVSATPNEPPKLDAPLLGVLYPHPTVIQRDAAPIFLARPGGGGGGACAQGELVLVLPSHGPLALDDSAVPTRSPADAETERFALARRLAASPRPARPPKLHWKPRGARTGRLVVSRSLPGAIRCRHGPGWVELGTPTLRAPALTLTTTRRGDPLWQLERAARPVLLGEAPEPDSDVSAELLEWADGACLAHGLSALAALPAGQYLLLRVAASACTRDGDELRLPGDARVVAPTAGPPDVSQPLVGLVVAPGSTHAKLVFSPLVVPIAPHTSAMGDLVVALPLTGELVTHADETAAVRWEHEGGPAFASTLSGGAAP